MSITDNIQTIRTATYGRDMRSAIADGLEELSSQMDDNAIEGSSVPSNVRTAIYTLLNNAVFDDNAVYTDELAIVQSWASEVTAITLNQSSIAITGTGTYQLTATTTPSGGAVSWTSSDTSVATVSSSGLVTGVSNGSVTITASSGDVSATCTAAVSGNVTLTGIEAVYTQGGTVYTTASLSDLVSDLVVTATYDDSSTATLTSDQYTLSGTLTEGTSTITVTYGGFTDTFTVTVSSNTETLTVLGAKDSGRPSIADNGDSTYSMSVLPTDSSITVDNSNPYWTCMNVSNSQGGTLNIHFDDTYVSGQIQIMLYASRNQEMTDIVGTLNNSSWDTEYEFTQNTRNVNADCTVELISGAYTWVWIRNYAIIMGEDTSSSSVNKHGYIRDGHITFTITQG